MEHFCLVLFSIPDRLKTKQNKTKQKTKKQKTKNKTKQNKKHGGGEYYDLQNSLNMTLHERC